MLLNSGIEEIILTKKEKETFDLPTRADVRIYDLSRTLKRAEGKKDVQLKCQGHIILLRGVVSQSLKLFVEENQQLIFYDVKMVNEPIFTVGACREAVFYQVESLGTKTPQIAMNAKEFVVYQNNLDSDIQLNMSLKVPKNHPDLKGNNYVRSYSLNDLKDRKEECPYIEVREEEEGFYLSTCKQKVLKPRIH